MLTLGTADNRLPDPSGPYDHMFLAYGASKVLAYNATLDFIENEKPHFSVINVMPSFVVGKNELATTKESAMSGTNRLAMAVLFGDHNPDGQIAGTVHVDDVAFVHIASLNPKIKGNRNFATNSGGLNGTHWDDAIEIVKKHFPDEVKRGTFPLGGHWVEKPVIFDASNTEKVFNFKFGSFEEQIVSAAGWYAEIAGKE